MTGRPHYPPGRLRKGPRRPEPINNGANNNGGNRREPLYIYNPILFGPKATYGQPGRGYEGTLFIVERRDLAELGLCMYFFLLYWLGRSTYFAGWQGWGQRWASTLAKRSNARHRPNIRAPPRPLPPDICTQSVGICVASMVGSDS